MFEEAIFIIKEDFLGRCGHANALKEAQDVANAYIRGAVTRSVKRLRIPPLLCAVIGALISAAVILAIYYL